MKKTSEFSAESNRARNATIITFVLMIVALPTAALFIYSGYKNSLPQLYIPAFSLIVTIFFDIYPLSLIRNKRRINYAMMLVMSAFIVNVLIVPFVLQGLGILIALSIVLVLLSISLLTMSAQYATPGLIIAVLAGAVAIIFDTFLGDRRVNVPELEQFTPILFATIVIPLVFVFLGEFNRFNLQTKVTLGILLTGGVTVTTLVFFGVNRFSVFSDFLADKFEANVIEKTEADLLNTINLEAQSIDNTFLDIQSDLFILDNYLVDLIQRRNVFGSGSYWNANEQIVQMPSGQFSNSKNDTASVFIPNKYALSEELITDLNSAIHLDLVAPEILQTHAEVAAVYYISKLGYTIYYPNIDLAQKVPPDFDPTQEAFYTIATPAANPERLPHITQPYSDPAGAGLIVTLSVPVYNGDSFEGVIGADIQLAKIINAVSQLRLGSSGIPILIDSNGLILSMNEAGYAYFNIEPEVVAVNESPTQTIFDLPDPKLQDVAQQIYNSQTGLSRFEINGIETYVSTSVLKTIDYKLVFIAPVSELSSEVEALRKEVDIEFFQTIQDATIILTILFLGAFVISLIVGQVITRPLKRLTETAEQIARGNLSSRASIETEDESGILARAFNTMADELTNNLQGLENRIAQRTRELELLSQNNAYRASLFESIAQISRIISSTRNMEQLLPQIAETISTQLGYYHVGIFLVDTHKEYAILMAANSIGGKAMLERSHRLRIGETGIVGYVTQSGSPRVALDVGQDAVFFNNPDLPETHSEVALPLRSGTEIIGALDVQSTKPNAFTEEDVNILSTLADQVSIAIQNASSFQQSRDALSQAERAAAQLSVQQWSQYQQQQKMAGYHFDGISVQKRVQKAEKDIPNSLSIPIILRGVQIGTLKLSAYDQSRKWDENEIAMAQATANRTALAVETARLLQDAQKRASKERTIGQISSKIGSLVNLDNIIQTTVQELGENLSGTEVAIQFTTGQAGQ